LLALLLSPGCGPREIPIGYAGDGGGATSAESLAECSASEATVHCRSIGTRAGPLYATGTATVASGGSEVTFGAGAALPDSIGPGDKLVLGAAAETLYVLARESTTKVKVQASAAQSHASVSFQISRAYASISAWEADRGGDLVAENRREIGVCYHDGVFRERVTLAGATTDRTRYRHLTAAARSRHRGLAGGGVVIEPSDEGHAVEVLEDYARIEWIEVTRWKNGPTSRGHHGIAIGADQVLIQSVIVHDDTPQVGVADPQACGIALETAGRTAYVRNSIVYRVAAHRPRAKRLCTVEPDAGTVKASGAHQRRARRRDGESEWGSSAGGTSSGRASTGLGLGHRRVLSDRRRERERLSGPEAERPEGSAACLRYLANRARSEGDLSFRDDRLAGAARPGSVADPAGSVADPAGSPGDPAGSHADPAGSVADPAGSHADPAGSLRGWPRPLRGPDGTGR